MKKIKYFAMMIIIFCLLISISSTSYTATNTLTITCDENGNYTFSPNDGNSGRDGTLQKPIQISLKYSVVEIKYNQFDKMKFPFCFQILPNGEDIIGSYIINHNYKDKIITFTLMGTRTNIDIEPFRVAPGNKDDGYSYVQGGAVLNQDFENTISQPPTFKIVSTEIMSSWSNRHDVLMTQLGNTYIETDSVAATLAPYPSAYVFAASDVAKNKIYKFIEEQRGKNILSKEVYKDDYKYVKDKTYLMEPPRGVSRGSEYKLDTEEKTKIIYSFFGEPSTNLDQEPAGGVEKEVSKILISIGNVFMKIVNAVGGENISIDAFIFNEYEDTVIDFFDGARGTYVDMFQTVINGWYKAFQIWTILILMILLVAIGIKSMLYAGTGDQRKISVMIVGWILAVVCLFFGPFAMKYGIKLNDALVNMFRKESKYSLYSVFKFDFEPIYQLGEDSFTTTLLGQLETLQGETTAKIEEIEEKMEEIKNSLDNNSLIDYFNSAFIWATKGVLHWDGIAVGKGQKLINMIVLKINKDRDFYKEPNAFDKVKYLWGIEGFNQRETELTPEEKQEIYNYADTYASYLEQKELLEEIQKGIDLVNSRTERDLLKEIQERASTTSRLVYVFVWYVLIFQLVLLMILYYKRLITVAVLIILFPLVVMVYAFEKFLCIEKPLSMKTWIMEYVVNIFIQSVHAFIYIMLIETGITLYTRDKDNWLIFLFAVTALFPMESLIKGMLGMKASTVSNLKDSAKKTVGYSAAALAIAKARGKYSDVDDKHEAQNEKNEKKYQKQDKKTELERLERDNNIRSFANITGNPEDSRRRLEQNKAKDKQEDETKKAKREAIARRNNRMKSVKKGVQVARNINAKFSAITTGLAGGGDAQDFAAGAAIAGVMAGNTRPSISKIKKTEEGNKKSGSRYSGVGVNNSRGAQENRRNADLESNGVGNYGGTGNTNPNVNADQNVNANPNIDTNANPNIDSNANTNTNDSAGEKTKVKESVADAIRNQIANNRTEPTVESSSQYNVIDYDNELDE